MESMADRRRRLIDPEPNTAEENTICYACGSNRAYYMDFGRTVLCPDCQTITDTLVHDAHLAAGKLPDSGARREFESGAVRDISEGKGRCDLLPLCVVSELTNDPLFRYIEEFKNTKEVKNLYIAIGKFSRRVWGNDKSGGIYSMSLELSKHFEAGAKKYSENNWKKGIPLHCYIDSGVRHYLKYLRGDTDEPHDRAFVWNMVCAIWTIQNKPELDDIETDLVDDKYLRMVVDDEIVTAKIDED